MTEELKCLRCGKCCHFIVEGEVKKCRYLVPQKDGTTLCRIYKDRIGKVLFPIDKKKRIVCIERKDSPVNFPGCPYNVLAPEKPVLFGDDNG